MNEKKSVTITRSERYVIDGKEYHSLDEIPESERKKLEASLELLKRPTTLGQVAATKNTRSHMEFKEVRVSTDENATDAATELLRKVMDDFSADKSVAREHEPNKNAPSIVSLPPELQQKSSSGDKVKYYVIIAALLGVIAYLLLK